MGGIVECGMGYIGLLLKAIQPIAQLVVKAKYGKSGWVQLCVNKTMVGDFHSSTPISTSILTEY